MRTPTRSSLNVNAKRSILILFLGVIGALAAADAPAQQPGPAQAFEIEASRVALGGTPYELSITNLTDDPLRYQIRDARGTLIDEGEAAPEGATTARPHVQSRDQIPLTVIGAGQSERVRPRFLPGWFSLLPPLIAIAFALIFREVVISLFAGVWLGALILVGFNPLEATLRAIDRFALGALGNSDHIAIIVFSLMLGGMVGVITRSGGTRGVVDALQRFATSRRRGQLFGWISGLAIFFDDYANTLIRGNTLRPMTDRLRISREKLAYIVDSVAAPIAVIAPISTWVGFEIAMIREGLDAAAAQTADPAVQEQLLAGNAFMIFLQSIPYLFYPILAIVFVLMIVVTGREFGPMRTAESRAATGGGLYRPGAMLAADTEGELAEPKDVPARWYNAVVPILVVIAAALAALYHTGSQGLPEGALLRDVIGEADPFVSLLWASSAGVLAAIVLAVAQRILSINGAVQAWVGGMKSMLLAIVILVLAWSLGGVTQAVGTGDFLAALLADTLPLAILPTLVFVIAALTAFATGTSWGTMAILFPIVVPLSITMGAGMGIDGNPEFAILLGSIAAIMAGAVFGDHASPISDTTVISSMSSGCDHIDHVRTQLPYALAVAVVSIGIGSIPTALWGVHPAISLVVGSIILYLLLRFLGRPIETDDAAGMPADGASRQDRVAAGPLVRG